jgi:hypothetical protein
MDSGVVIVRMAQIEMDLELDKIKMHTHDEKNHVCIQTCWLNCMVFAMSTRPSSVLMLEYGGLQHKSTMMLKYQSSISLDVGCVEDSG